jgi:hypothetical protein
MFKKIVQRVPVGADPVSDLIALIDLIEIELGLSTGGQSERNLLFEVVSEIRRSEDVASQESVSVLLEVIERLRKIEPAFVRQRFRDWLGDSISQKIRNVFPFREKFVIAFRSIINSDPPRSLDETPCDPSNRDFGAGPRRLRKRAKRKGS